MIDSSKQAGKGFCVACNWSMSSELVVCFIMMMFAVVWGSELAELGGVEEEGRRARVKGWLDGSDVAGETDILHMRK